MYGVSAIRRRNSAQVAKASDIGGIWSAEPAHVASRFATI
jgi:hypothetical protein